MKKPLRRALVVCGVIVLGIVVFPFLAPRVFSLWRSDIIFRIPNEEKTIYLTIDDAPTEGTPAILEALKRQGVHATFFVISGRVHSPQQLDQIIAEGHTIGNHMKSIRAGWKLSYEEFIHDFDECTAVLRAHADVRFFRPPSGYASKEEVAYARSKGMEAILGSVYPFDAHLERTGILVRLASWLSVNGGIIILHDGNERGARTAEVLDRLIPILKARGYRFGELPRPRPSS